MAGWRYPTGQSVQVAEPFVAYVPAMHEEHADSEDPVLLSEKPAGQAVQEADSAAGWW